MAKYGAWCFNPLIYYFVHSWLFLLYRKCQWEQTAFIWAFAGLNNTYLNECQRLPDTVGARVCWCLISVKYYCTFLILGTLCIFLRFLSVLTLWLSSSSLVPLFLDQCLFLFVAQVLFFMFNPWNACFPLKVYFLCDRSLLFGLFLSWSQGRRHLE